MTENAVTKKEPRMSLTLFSPLLRPNPAGKSVTSSVSSKWEENPAQSPKDANHPWSRHFYVAHADAAQAGVERDGRNEKRDAIVAHQGTGSIALNAGLPSGNGRASMGGQSDGP
jgi:hypothetical protein